MARATGKDHSEINLAIWGDDDWLDLTPPAQHLYFVLWTSPQLSYCGAGEWHPGRIAALSNGWTAARVESAGAELSSYLFLVIDADTEEFLLRSWIKHDGLWKKPNMAVSMANARAALASRTLRGVVVHEVKKIKARNLVEAKAGDAKEAEGWQRDAVKDLLSQKAIDPASLPPFTPRLTPGLTPSATPGLTPDLSSSTGVGVNPPSNPGPTPAPSSAPFLHFSSGGYVSTEGHQGATTETPRPNCPDHEENFDGPCRKCQRRREWDDNHEAEIKRDEDARKQLLRDIAKNCPDCHGTNTIDDGFTDDGYPVSRRCDHGLAVDHA